MGLPEVYCPICGCPSGISFDLYSVEEDIGDPTDYWGSVLPAEQIEWLTEYRLLGRVRSLKGYCSKFTKPPKNTSNVEGLFISEHANYIPYDGDVYQLPDTDGNEWRAYQYDKEHMDVLFPIHDTCLDIAGRFIQNWNENRPDSAPALTLENFYDALCGEYSRNWQAGRDHPARGSWMAAGLEWDHALYGARALQGYNGWEGEHGDEWICADPINIPKLTSFIASLLKEGPGSAVSILDISHLQVSQPEAHFASNNGSLGGLPVEILHQIAFFLPAATFFSLRQCSKALASRLVLDQKFWCQQLLSGSLIPQLWGIDGVYLFNNFKLTMQAKYGGEKESIECDWKALAKQFARTDDIMMRKGDMKAVPIGIANRFRVWRIVEEAILSS
ncbi:hypothetical protein BGZ60DRAFT_523917 [Tricladium varicosporioides]|nr:hypothetical protein BGZ60DRAFT_523917 [Hymenoscyphus varicosporioides]